MKKKLLSLMMFLLAAFSAQAEMKQTDDGYYLITNVDDLQEFCLIIRNGGANASAKGRLMADLDMTGVDFYGIGVYADTGTGGAQTPFQGVFDGNGHVISNFRMVRDETDPHEVGFFSRANGGATIKNLGIVNAYVESKMGKRAGIMFGECHNSTVENCFTAGELTIVTAHDQKGGMAGEAAGSTTFTNCYTTYENISASLGNPNGLINAYAIDAIEDILATGELCYIMNGDQKNIIYRQTLGTDAFPTFGETHAQVYANGKVNCDGTPLGDVSYSNEDAGNVVPEHEFGGDGFCVNCGLENGAIEPAKDGWYEITNCWELRWVGLHIINGGQNKTNIRLMNDIDMSDVVAFPPIGKYMDSDSNQRFPFQGIFDGQNHIIYNLRVEVSSGEEAGLFGRVNGGATIKNLGIVNANITNNANIRAGVLAGEIHESTVTNVFTAGDLYVTTSHNQCNHFAGEAEASKLTNCYTTGERMAGGNVTFNNCYWGDDASEGAESGSLAFRLNGKSIINPIYYQNLGEDEFPVLDSTHGLVYKSGEEDYASATTPDQYEAMITSMVEAEKEVYEEAMCSQALKNNYFAQLDKLVGPDLKAYLKGYDALGGLREALQQSKAAYDTYLNKVNEVSAYLASHDDFEGEDRTALETYLKENVEPCETYPNGSYPYIRENLNLTNAQAVEEADFLAELLKKAIANGYKSGADITSLLVNGNFAKGAEGWTLSEGRLDGNFATSGDVKNVQKVTTAMEMTQTLEGLKNGVYLFTMPGYTEVSGVTHKGAYNYSGFVTANGYKNYYNTQRSNLQSAEMQETYGTGNFVEKMDEEGSIAGYAPCSVQGVSYAIQNGYYQNTILVNVTDGNLTVGISNQGTKGKTNDIFMGGTKLQYLGTLEDASAQVDAVLADMAEKGNHMLNDYIFDEGSYADAPNFYQGLKDQLQQAIDAVGNAADAQAKYELIGTFGQIFQDIRDNKAAYVALLSGTEELYAAYYDMEAPFEEQQKIEETFIVCADMHAEGSADTQTLQTYIDKIATDHYYLLIYGTEPEHDANGVYQLQNAYNVVWFAAEVNKRANAGAKAVLTNDIDMREVTNFTPIGRFVDNAHGAIYTTLFSGTFDGQNHIIRNLNIARTDVVETGFFGRTSGATIKNLGFVDAHVANYQGIRAGVLGGEIYNSTVTNVFAFGDLQVDTEHAQAGFCGEGANSTFTNCYCTLDFFCGESSTTKNNCYSGEDIALLAPSGELCYKMNGDQKNIVWYQKLGEDEYPVLDPARGQVYVTGPMDCGGNFLGDFSYTNTPNENELPEHDFDEDGLCTVCGADAGEIAPDEDGWYNVATAWNLRFISQLVSSMKNQSPNVRLVADIDLSTVGEFPAIGHNGDNMPNSSRYAGTFDGQGHIISNLTVVENDLYEAGLFGRASGATIKNLGIVNASITNTTPKGIRVGVLGGELQNCDIINCWTTGNIELNSAHIHKGGIAGELSETRISSCWTTHTSFGALGTRKNCYYGEDVEAMHASGELCFKLNDGNVVNPAWRQNLGEDQYPVLNDTHKIVYFENDEYTNGASELASHSGTQDDPFVITTASDMAEVHKYLVPGQLNYIKLGADLDMSNITNWVPLNNSTKMVGTLSFMAWIDFDGQGHTISNFSAKDPNGEYQSFFGVLCGACRNVNFVDVDVECTITGNGALGGYVGHSNYKDLTFVDHVSVTGKVVGHNSYCGGMFGNVGGATKIQNSYVNVDIESDVALTGGIIGRVRGALEIQNCYAAGSFNRGGGIVGGGQQDATPASIYNNIVVWNNNYENFGTTAAGDKLTNISYYNDTNFAELQQTVVAWDPTLWSVEGDEYPVLVGISTAIQTVEPAGDMVSVYSLTGVRLKNAVSRSAALKNLPQGIYIVGGKKVFVK